MINTRENHFWKINNVLANSWWRGIDRNCGAGWGRDKQEEHQAIHICLVHSKKYMNEYAHEARWWTKDNFAKERIRMWALSGAWASLQPPSRQRSISADMMYGLCPSWVCPAPQPRRAWLPGTASGKQAVCRLLWSHGCGDFQKWSAWWSLLGVPLSTSIPGISKLSGKKPEEVSNWLFILSRQQAQGAVWSGECCSGRMQAQKATFIPWLKPVSTVPGDYITHRKNLLKSPMHHKICHPTGGGDSVSVLVASEL